MPAIRGLDLINGQPVWIDAVSGDGLSAATAFVLRRSDPNAQAQLLTIAQALTVAWSFDSFVTTQANRIVKSSGGRLYSVTAHNRNASTTYWLMLFDRTSAPDANATDFLLMSLPLFPGTLLSLGRETLGGGGLSLPSGIVYGFSSNANQYVAIAAPTDVRAFVGFS